MAATKLIYTEGDGEPKCVICNNKVAKPVGCSECEIHLFHPSCLKRHVCAKSVITVKENEFQDASDNFDIPGENTFLIKLLCEAQRTNGLLCENISIMKVNQELLKQNNQFLKEQVILLKKSLDHFLNQENSESDRMLVEGHIISSVNTSKNKNKNTSVKRAQNNRNNNVKPIPNADHVVAKVIATASPVPPTANIITKEVNRKQMSISDDKLVEHDSGVNKKVSPLEETSSWSQVTRKKRTHNLSIIGSSVKSTIEAAPKKAWIYISRIKTGVKPEQFEDDLRPLFPEIMCEEMISKYPEYYSSFKITINAENFDKALQSDVWPNGAYVNRFFRKRTVNK